MTPDQSNRPTPPNPPTPSNPLNPPTGGLTRTGLLIRLGAIGAVVAGVGGAFVYTAGWFHTDVSALSPQRIVDTFQRNAGDHPGFRRNHAKGTCVTGYFDSNGNGAPWSRAEVFQPGRTPVIGRFAIPGGNPGAPDASVPVRSMALLFSLKNGEQWRTGMNTIPIFAVSTPQAFYEQLKAMQPEKTTGKPDPAKVQAFAAAHPETKRLGAWMKTHAPSSGFENAAYYSIDAFEFTNAAGEQHFVRWSVAPETSYQSAAPQNPQDHDFLSKKLNDSLQQGPLRWHLMLTIAQPGDVTNDATLAWPESRQTVDVGTVVIDAATPQQDGVCRDVNFDPTVLPDGMAPSDDPLLAARSAAYSVSYNRRTREEAQHPGTSFPPSSGDR